MSEPASKVSRKAESLLVKGIQTLEAGDLGEANQLFREVLKHDPQNLTALIMAAGSSATRQEALAFLKQAQVLSPGNPEIQKSLEWARLLPTHENNEETPETPHEPPPSKPWWVSQPLPAGRKSRGWLYGLSGLMIVIIILAVYLINQWIPFFSQRDAPGKPEPQIIFTPEVVSPTLRALPATWTPQVTQLPVSITSTVQGTHAFVTATPPATMAIEYDQRAYPPVDVVRFINDPGLYTMQRLSLDGSLVWLGEIEVNGVLSFALLVDGSQNEEGTAMPYSPILVVDAMPTPDLTVGMGLRIYGMGYQPGGVVMVQGLQWEGPVISQQSMQVLP